MNEKQQQLTFDKGITNVPSDALCSDNALEESLGMVYDNGEHRVIQKPVVFMTGTQYVTIVYVHRFNNEKRFIGYMNTVAGIKLVAGKNVNGVYTALAPIGGSAPAFEIGSQVTSIGKTLIISDSQGLHYYLWTDDSYKSIGDKIPDPEFEFWLRGDDGVSPSTGDYYVYSDASVPDNTVKPDSFVGASDAHEIWNNIVIGLYAKNEKTIAAKKGFCKPFFVRTALRMYDDSYTHISQPMLFFPCVTQNSWGRYLKNNNNGYLFGLYMNTKYCKLYFKQSKDLTDWSDLVKGIDIFISDGIEIYNRFDDQILEDMTTSSIMCNGIFSNVNAHNSVYRSTTCANPTEGSLPHYTVQCCECLVKLDEKDIENEIKATSIFYKICSIGLESITDKGVDEYMSVNTLENLTTQRQLPEDDYYSRCKLVPDYIYAYNSRLNLTGVKRGFFNGFAFFIGWDNANAASHDIYVTIKTDSGEYTVCKQTGSVYSKMDQYFFYPDARAIKVYIDGVEHQLTEHPALNGAYYFAGLPQPPQSQSQSRGANREINEDGEPTDPNNNNNEAEQILDPNIDDGQGGGGGGTGGAGTEGAGDTENPGGAGGEGAGGGQSTTPSYDNDTTELLPNYIIQSEVNNPWVFKAAGYFRVGNGKIMAMSTITQALSEGQFGYYPLLVFSDDGIWALSVANTGYYSSVHPMSREVCNNRKSITQTDGAVFFASEKGLMVVVGSQVKCVSEQLSGKDISFIVTTEQTVNLGNFVEYLKEAFIAYDYRDSLLWIFNNSYDACWVYSIKSGTFGKYDFGANKRVTNVVNFYPDYLMQNADGVLSLLERPNINNDGTTVSDVFTPNTYNTKLITRPMKFENALALKSIMQIRHIKDFTPYTTTETVNEENVTHNWPKTELRIFASNNMDHWAELGSLRGMPWKYYKFRFDFTGLKATDRFSGSMIVTQERRTNKMR